jgi:Beta-galactosidase
MAFQSFPRPAAGLRAPKFRFGRRYRFGLEIRVHLVMIRRFGRLGRFAIAALLGWATRCSPQPPELFFYPPPFQLGDGSILSSPVTVDASQITIDFPVIHEMAGVVLIVYWSQLCPSRDHCDFSMIDEVLSYWGARHKKVVLAVATVGFPIKTVQDGKTLFRGATPQWVLDKATGYEEQSRAIDTGHHEATTWNKYPSYRDPEFRKDVRELVQSLSRYDGNPVIDHVRISTGMLTEDNASPDGLKYNVAGFGDEDWIRYCEAMLGIFSQAFPHTGLEFDIGRISWAYARGDPNSKKKADAFVRGLIKHKVFLAFDGLRSEIKSVLSQGPETQDGEARSIQYLHLVGQHGLPVGLEAFGPFTNPKMHDAQALLDVIDAIRPSRLVLFADVAGSLNFRREGANHMNVTTAKLYSVSRVNEIADYSERLLQLCRPTDAR